MKNGAFSAHLSSLQHYPLHPVCTQERREDTELREERKAEEGLFLWIFFSETNSNPVMQRAPLMRMLA